MLALSFFRLLSQIVVGGTDMDIRFLVNLKLFIGKECIVGLCSWREVAY